MAHGHFPLWATMTDARPWTPCQALYAALLWDAWHCIRTSPKPKLRQEAWLWFSGYGGQVTFWRACEVLELDPTAVQRAVFSRWGDDEDGALTLRFGTTTRTRPLRHAGHVARARHAP
jgi:hypothetical protein